MLNRRHLRIKVLQALYAFYQSEQDNLAKTEKELLNAIDRIYDLYIYFLLSFSELKQLAEIRIEDNKKKIFPTEDDLSPNLKFVGSSVISALEASTDLRKISEETKVNWIGDENREMFRKMFNQLREDETYFTFMNNGQTGQEEDVAFAVALFRNDIANSPLIYHFFEEKSIQWLDDIDLAASMVIKTIKGIDASGKVEIMPLFKDEEDEMEFVKTLLRKTVAMDSESEKLIDELTDNWELDRIAKMDVLLMKMAITELQVFNNIPKKVTINEYIEISKFYSTPKSHSFINGILDKAVIRLEKENKIRKIGRGLMN